MQSITITIEYSGIQSDNTSTFTVSVKRNGKESPSESKTFPIEDGLRLTAWQAEQMAVIHATELLVELNLLPNNR